LVSSWLNVPVWPLASNSLWLRLPLLSVSTVLNVTLLEAVVPVVVPVPVEPVLEALVPVVPLVVPVFVPVFDPLVPVFEAEVEPELMPELAVPDEPEVPADAPRDPDEVPSDRAGVANVSTSAVPDSSMIFPKVFMIFSYLMID
jgi:hypothetical protein